MFFCQLLHVDHDLVKTFYKLLLSKNHGEYHARIAQTMQSPVNFSITGYTSMKGLHVKCILPPQIPSFATHLLRKKITSFIFTIAKLILS